jgi:hemoglobin-like flavoprotein
LPWEITPDMNMTREQKRLVRESFANIREMAGPISLLFYGKLFELAPDARRLFHNDLRLQGLKLMETLGSLVDSLDRFDQLQGHLAELGRRHAGYGVKPEQYDVLKVALLWSLHQGLGNEFDAETRAAWTLVIEAVNRVMIGAVPAGA